MWKIAPWLNKSRMGQERAHYNLARNGIKVPMPFFYFLFNFLQLSKANTYLYKVLHSPNSSLWSARRMDYTDRRNHCQFQSHSDSDMSQESLEGKHDTLFFSKRLITLYYCSDNHEGNNNLLLCARQSRVTQSPKTAMSFILTQWEQGCCGLSFIEITRRPAHVAGFTSQDV